MKSFAFAAVSLAVCLLLFGCARPNVADFLAYQASAWVIDADFTVGSSRYSAAITLGPGEKPFAERDFSVTYTAPQNLAGLTAARKGGSDTLSLGDLQIPAAGDEFANMLEICRLFCIEDADYYESKPVELGGAGCLYVRLGDALGTYGIYLDSAAKLPKRIEAQLSDTQIVVDIKKMEAQPAQSGQS